METEKTSSPTYPDYFSASFTPVLCKGYHPEHNQTKDYEKAKEPAFKGWNSREYVPPTLEEISRWEKAGGWTGWIPPKETIVLDVDNGQDDTTCVRDICWARGIEPGIHRTNNGLHFCFHTDRDLPGASRVDIKAGLNITYRVAGKNQVIFAPVNGRTWELWKEPKDLPPLPDELLPYDRKNLQDVLNCLSWQIGKAYREGHFSGYDDLDAAFMGLLIDRKLSAENIHRAFQKVFGPDYDERQTESMYQRTRERINIGDPVIGAGTFVQKVKECRLEEISRFIRELDFLCKAKKDEQKQSPPAMVFTPLSDLLKETDERVSWVWDGILPTGGLSLIAAKPKAGKSTIARQLSHCVVQGLDFLGKKTEQGPVLYCAFEEKRGEVKRHFRLMGTEGPLHSYINVAPVDAIRQLEQAITEIEPVLVIIDTLMKLCRVSDGNSYTEVIAAIEPLLKLARDTGTSVLCVHHTSKGDRQGGDSILGSTGIFATVDTSIIVKRNEKYRTIQTIQRYGEDMEETTLKWDPDRRMVDLGKSRQEEDLDAMEEALLQFLQSQEEPLIEAAIDEAVEGRKALKVKALRNLVEKKQVERTGKGGKGDPFRYSCSLVPNIYVGTTKQENQNDSKPNNGVGYSCSGVFIEHSHSREQEFSGISLPEDDLPDVEVIA